MHELLLTVRVPAAPPPTRGTAAIFQEIDYAADVVTVVHDAGNMIDQYELAMQHMHSTTTMLR